MEVRWRFSDVAIWRYGVLEACCRRGDEEAGGMEVWNSAGCTAGVSTWSQPNCVVVSSKARKEGVNG